jgi:hypothetical protein
MSSLFFPPRHIRAVGASSDDDVGNAYRRRNRIGSRRVQRLQDLAELTRMEQRLRGQPGSRRHRRYLNSILSDNPVTDTDFDQGEGDENENPHRAMFAMAGPDFFHSKFVRPYILCKHIIMQYMLLFRQAHDWQS